MADDTNKQIFGADTQNLKTTRSDYQPGNCAQQQENEVKTAIVAMLLTSAIASPSYAGTGQCYIHPETGICEPTTFYVVRFRDIAKETPTYQSRSQMVIRSTYGTSVINSTYRSYSR